MASCMMPIKVKPKKGDTGDRDYATHLVPCGKCPVCRQRRVNAWVFRLLQEEKIHKGSIFATLTYAPENVPISTNGFMTLQKPDWQKFMKRLRKNTGIRSIKYYMAGEYGTKTFRPHYHALMFDVSRQDVAKAWQLGHCHFGSLTSDSIAYTCKYICKPSRIPMFETDDRLPEFSLMSKKLGLNYLSPAMVRYHQENEFYHVTQLGGYPMALPRYFRDKIFSDEDRRRYARSVSAKYALHFDKDVEDAGGIKEFYKQQHERVKALLRAAARVENRDKI